jgi:hypothetical protein
LRDAKAREPPTVVRHAIEIWCLNSDRSEAAKIAVAQIIGIHKHEIRPSLSTTRRMCAASQSRQHEHRNCENSHHRRSDWL